MDMILVSANFKKGNFEPQGYLFAYVLQFPINLISYDYPSIFCRTHQMVELDSTSKCNT
jgi:hypothetical protein